MADLKSIAKNSDSFKSTKPTNNVAKAQSLGLEKNQRDYQANHNPANNLKNDNQSEQPKKDNLGKQLNDVRKMATNPNSVPEERQEELAKKGLEEVASKAATAYAGPVAGEAARLAAEKFNQTKMGAETAKKTVKLFKGGRTIIIVSVVLSLLMIMSYFLIITVPILLIADKLGIKINLSGDNEIINKLFERDISDDDDYLTKKIAEGGGLCDFIDCDDSTGGSSSSEVASYISSETTYTAQAGDTLESIAAKYGVSIESLKAINNLADDYVLEAGAILKIPLATQPIDIAEGKSWNDYASPTRRFDINGGAACYENDKLVSNTGCNHTGIDFNRNGIGTGTPVYSLAKGTIVKAIFGTERYGFHVVVGYDINNDDKYDYYSLYAHLSVILVSEGASVNAGQKVGEVGSTGNSSGAHLHFEIRNSNYNVIDPAPILDKIEKGESVLSTAV